MSKIFISQIMFPESFLRKLRQALLFVILSSVTHSSTSFAAKTKEAIIEVIATKITSNDFYEKYPIVGKVRAENSKTYYAAYEGTIDTVAAFQGQQVKKDDVILTVDSEIANALKAKAESAYESAKTTFDRDNALWSKKIISKDVLDKSRLALETAKADLATQTDKYQHMIIRAPFDGTIGAIPAYIGKYIKTGDYLVTIIAEGAKIISVELPESLSGKIDSNSEVSLIDNKESKVTGSISAISGYLNDNGTITANIIFLAETNILHGSYAEIEIIYNKHTGLAIPEKAVLKNNKGNFIYKIEKDNKLKQIYVTTKTRLDNLIEISSAEIQADDMVVLEGLTKAYDGASVSLMEYNIEQTDR